MTAHVTPKNAVRAQIADSSASTAPVSVVVLTKNEERNLEDCLASVAGWCREILIVDSGSTDATMDIARRYGAHVFEHPFEGHTRQWNWAFSHLPFTCEWALCIDADQRILPELREEITRLLTTPGAIPADVAGAYINRRQIFRGKWIKHGTYYPKPLLKLLKPAVACCDERELMDSRFYVQGRTIILKHDLVEDNSNEQDIRFWIAKHNRYAELQAREEFERAERCDWKIKPAFFGTPDQRSLWLRALWYRHMPLYVRPFIYFFYRYFLRLGFLDGKQGFVFHFMQALWFRLLVDVNLDELRQAARKSS
jgi:glycosyltransferase involved in cell wall biosynthesis